MPTVTWKPPSIPGAAQFALWDGALFGYVTQTAYRDDRWRISIFPSGVDDGKGVGCYVRNGAQAKKFVERWAQHNHASIAPPKGRQIMPHEGIRPRMPKGSDERS